MKQWLSLFSLVLLLQACSSEPQTAASRNATLPSSSGSPAEVLLVVEDKIWNGPVREALLNTFALPVAGLPQEEPLFDLVKLDPANFSNLLRRSHILVVVGLDSVVRKDINRNVYAFPQIVLKFSAPTQEELVRLLLTEKEKWRKTLIDFDLNFVRQKFKKQNVGLPKDLRALGYNMLLPTSFEPGLNETQTKIFWNRAMKSDQGIIIHYRPMPDSLAFLGTDVLALRDSLTQAFIPGEIPGSYMRTEDQVPPVITSTEIGGMFALEARGLWKTEGDFMGGPYLNYTVFDEANQRIITLDGFVFAPEMDKRRLMLELEALLTSFELVK